MPEYTETQHTKEVDPKGLRGPLWTLAGTGIATAVAALNGGGFGGLGGLFGGGNQAAAMAAGGAGLAVLAEKDAEIARLRAGERGDTNDVALYKQTLADNNALRDEFYAFVRPLADEASRNRERVAVLESQMKDAAEKAALREEILRKDIQLERQARECCCSTNATAIAGVQSVLGQITKIGIPNAALCPGVPPVTVTHTTTAAA